MFAANVIHENDGENAGETNFDINVDYGRTPGVCSTTNMKCTDVFNDGKGLTMLVHLSRGRDSNTETLLLGFKKRAVTIQYVVFLTTLMSQRLKWPRELVRLDDDATVGFTQLHYSRYFAKGVMWVVFGQLQRLQRYSWDEKCLWAVQHQGEIFSPERDPSQASL